MDVLTRDSSVYSVEWIHSGIYVALCLNFEQRRIEMEALIALMATGWFLAIVYICSILP